MKGRMEKMPRVTSALVANVQKKSLERKAWKKAVSLGRRRAASTVTMLPIRNRATTGPRSVPSGTRRMANRAMTATRKAAPQMTAAGVRGMGADPLARRTVGGSLTAITVITRVMARMSAIAP